MEKAEISLLDLLLHIIKGWRSIFICMMVMAIGISGIQYIKDIKKVKTINTYDETITMTEEEKIEHTKATLEKLRSEGPLDEVKAVDKVIRLEKEYDQKIEYLRSSILMNMNPNDVNIARLQYWVDTNYKIDYVGTTDKDITQDIIEAYTNVVLNNSWQGIALKTIGLGIEPRFFSELVSVESNMKSATSSFTVVIRFNNIEQLEEIVDVLEDQLTISSTQISDIIGDHELKLVNKSIQTTVDTTIYNLQQTRNDAVLLLENNIASYKSLFNDNQKSVYKLEQFYNEESSEKIEFTEEQPILNLTPKIRFKYILFGAILGAFLICFIRGICYILSGSLKFEDIRDNWLGVTILGYIGQQNKSSHSLFGKIDDYIDKLIKRGYGDLSEKEQIHIVATDIIMHCNKKNLRSIYFSSTENDIEKRITEILNIVSQRGITANNGNSILNDALSMENMNKSDAVVLVEKINKSRYDNIKRVIHLCEKHEKEILGVVVIK